MSARKQMVITKTMSNYKDNSRILVIGCIVLALLCAALIGVIVWLVYQCEYQPQYQNQSMSLLNDQLNKLRKENDNLTATLEKCQTQFTQCKINLTRIKEQLTKELNQCELKKKEYYSQLQALNLSTVHRVHGYWIVLSTFCFMLLLN